MPRAALVLAVLFILVNSAFEEITVTGYVIEAFSHQGAAAITASTLIRSGALRRSKPLNVSRLSVVP